MQPPIERIKISQTAKDKLIKLKRITKIEQWNILCRYAFCYSLADPSSPSSQNFESNSNVEMSWQVFGGEIADLLIIALKQRCHNDGLDTEPETLTTQLKLHLHRGIDKLTQKIEIEEIKVLEDLIRLALTNN